MIKVGWVVGGLGAITQIGVMTRRDAVTSHMKTALRDTAYKMHVRLVHTSNAVFAAAAAAAAVARICVRHDEVCIACKSALARAF